jgi:hypothetical protein
MENKEILKLVNKCTACSLKHKNGSIRLDFQLFNGNIWLCPVDESSKTVAIDPTDICAMKIIYMNHTNTLFGQFYTDPREAVERFLAEFKLFAANYNGDSNE